MGAPPLCPPRAPGEQGGSPASDFSTYARKPDFDRKQPNLSKICGLRFLPHSVTGIYTLSHAYRYAYIQTYTLIFSLTHINTITYTLLHI